MNLPARSRSSAIALILALALIALGGWWYFADQGSATRGEALDDALQTVIQKHDTDQALVARIILQNYHETRTNAARWSGIYWGFTFLAATLSALAGLILKLESILNNETVKKDIAALFSVTAAVLIAVSTSGDFQRKWQANRVAAAELERIGYEFLEKNGDNPRAYLGPVGKTLEARHMAIVGSPDKKPAATVAVEK